MGEWLRAKDGQRLPAGQAEDRLMFFYDGLIEALARKNWFSIRGDGGLPRAAG